MTSKLLLVLTGFLSLGAQSRTESEIRYYGSSYNGRTTANGEIFQENLLTFASKVYPFQTRLRIRSGDKSVIVRCNDRGPNNIELSSGAFKILAPLSQGVIRNAEILECKE